MMRLTLEITDEQTRALPFDPEAIARQVILEVLTRAACPHDAEVSLLLLDEEAMRALNHAQRGIDDATDVLSFPNVPFDTACAFSSADESCFHPESGELMLGDIVVCVPRVFSQAEEYGHSVLREYAFLVAHSALHLIGYDHMTEEEAKDMETRQEDALSALGYTRELRC